MSQLKVILLNPPSLCVSEDRVEPPLGLLYLGAAIREAGFADVALVDLSGAKSEASIDERIAAIPSADVYGITSVCTNQAYVRPIVDRIRTINPGAYILQGGPNPSALPAETHRDSGADAVVVGEGEDALLRCVTQLQTGAPPRGIVPGIPREDLDGLAFPARDLADLTTYSRTLLGEPSAGLLSSRGCPYRCAHCNSIVMGGGSRRARYRSPGNVLAEVRKLRPEVRHFRFNDDMFTSNPRLGELLDGLAELDVHFRVFAGVEYLTAELSVRLRRAGCVHVSVGLESLDPENLAALGKGRQISFEGNVRRAREAGLTVRGFFMVGLPHDSDERIHRYFTAAATLELNEFSVYPLIPYPGTRVAMNPQRFGYTIVDPDPRNYVQIGRGQRTCFALQHERFGPDDVERWRKLAMNLLEQGGATPSNESVVAT